ncbi:hypothetical protein NDU88_007328 [Pleurodeles waltl]|uniref:Uncharacterized protein n=1 Tax=Pleurodeles waltl TaxID=8319 RepID=A0AAV7QKE4_PLEWA|nr:hypothetical protein NDU88_007328 [Pleurodeles waltl]
MVAPEGATTRLPSPAEGSLAGRPQLGWTGVTKHEQSWAEVRRTGRQRTGCRVRRREACREGLSGVQYEGRRKRRRDEGRHERTQKRTRRWKALVAWAVRTHLSEPETI